MLKLLTHQKRCSHFSGGSHGGGGQETDPLDKKPPLGVCSIIFPLFVLFSYIAHNLCIDCTTIILLAYCMLLLLLCQFPVAILVQRSTSLRMIFIIMKLNL